MPIHAMIEQEKGADGARAATRVHMRLETSGSLGGRQGSTVLIHNLSATGMLIETASDLDIGQRIAVTLPEAPDCTATIVWRSEALAGCRFDRPLSRAALSAARLRNPLPQDVDPASLAENDEMLADRLRRLRQERGLSRVELSNRTGFSKPSIWAWERELLAGEPASADAPGAAKRLHALIETSREEIAMLAGVEPGKVRITIEY